MAYDFGVKKTMLRQLGALATVTVVPAGTPADEVLALEPDGVFLSNGPGDPAALPGPTADRGRPGRARCRSSGSASATSSWPPRWAASTYKLPFGHHGGNHPVRRLATGRVEITCQNHNYAVAAGSLPGAEITHVNLNDGVIEGLRSRRRRRPSACSTTPRPARAPTTPATSSTSSATADGRRPAPAPAPRAALMPRRDDLESILVIGSGPIVIGQACEFDYSGTQACRVLAEEGFRVVLANSNPATIMTDPAMADRTYVEPLDPDVLTAIIERERPDALLPTLGGQTALNLTMALAERGVLDALRRRGDRGQRRGHRHRRGPGPVQGGHGGDRARRARARASPTPWTRRWPSATTIGYPIMVRPSYILGGGGHRHRRRRATRFAQLAAEGLAACPVGEILIEQSIAGWKEFELEVMRDGADNCVVICSIENLDPMGVHTGDSITVAPAQTLTDVEYQAMRDAAFACIRRVGVETGGSNVQFAVDPSTGARWSSR